MLLIRACELNITFSWSFRNCNFREVKLFPTSRRAFTTYVNIFPKTPSRAWEYIPHGLFNGAYPVRVALNFFFFGFFFSFLFFFQKYTIQPRTTWKLRPRPPPPPSPSLLCLDGQGEKIKHKQVSFLIFLEASETYNYAKCSYSFWRILKTREFILRTFLRALPAVTVCLFGRFLCRPSK